MIDLRERRLAPRNHDPSKNEDVYCDGCGREIIIGDNALVSYKGGGSMFHKQCGDKLK